MFRFDVSVFLWDDRMIGSPFVTVFAKPLMQAFMGAALCAALLVAGCSSSAPAPQPTPAPYSPATPRTGTLAPPAPSLRQDVALYKAGIKQGCVNQGIQRGDAPAGIDAFCGCIYEAFNRSLSPAQWQAASDAAKTMNSAEEAKVFAPYMSQAKSCKKLK